MEYRILKYKSRTLPASALGRVSATAGSKVTSGARKERTSNLALACARCNRAKGPATSRRRSAGMSPAMRSLAKLACNPCLQHDDEVLELISFPVTGLADLPLAERDLVLEVMGCEPVRHWLDISTVEQLPDSPFAVTHLEPLPGELARLVA
jgi:hypothetical protein